MKCAKKGGTCKRQVPLFYRSFNPGAPMSKDPPQYPWIGTTFGRMKIIVLGTVAAMLVAISVAAGYLTWGLPDVARLRSANPESTALMELRLREAEGNGKKLQIRQKWVPFEAIPQMLKHAVRVSEDAGFYQHKGIDFTEIRAAVRSSWRHDKPLRGASTITQQLAKNLYLSPKRSIWRKIKEVLIARRLEASLTKQRIFHLYLNVIELGPGIFGVEAASRHFFGKEVASLDLEEIVRLTAVIPRPLNINPAGESRYLNWRARWILDTLKRYGYISDLDHRTHIDKFR